MRGRNDRDDYSRRGFDRDDRNRDDRFRYQGRGQQERGGWSSSDNESWGRGQRAQGGDPAHSRDRWNEQRGSWNEQHHGQLNQRWPQTSASDYRFDDHDRHQHGRDDRYGSERARAQEAGLHGQYWSPGHYTGGRGDDYTNFTGPGRSEFEDESHRRFGGGGHHQEWDRGQREGYGRSAWSGSEREGSGFGRTYGESRADLARGLGGLQHGGFGSYGSSRGETSSGLGYGRTGSERSGLSSGYGGGRYGVGSGAYEESYGGYHGRGPKGYARSDERIREDVSERLYEDDTVDASEISVSVKDGEVTLSGTVETRRMKHRAEDIADAVSGVRDVHNQLRVNRGVMSQIADKVQQGVDKLTGNETRPSTSSTSANMPGNHRGAS